MMTDDPLIDTGLSAEGLCDCEEFFAAGFFSDEKAPLVVRMASGVDSHLKHVPLPPWRGTRLYPSDTERGKHSSNLYSECNSAVCFHYSRSMTWDRVKLTGKIDQASGQRRQILQLLETALEEYPYFDSLPGFCHSSINYRRVLAEGLDSYQARIEEGRAGPEPDGTAHRSAFYEAMNIVVEGIRTFVDRVVKRLGSLNGLTEEKHQRRTQLVDALRRVPFEPARTFHEAIVAENILYYLDGCDGLGRFDQDLIPYYRRDIEEGRLNREEASALVTELWSNVECTHGWNAAIGGTAPDGTEGSNELTAICLRAAHHRRGPNLALRLRQDTPQEIWDEAFRTLATGGGLPALYCEENYLKAIRGTGLGVREDDLPDYAFGGCTELMVHGKSNCGGADCHLNLPHILDKCIHAHLAECSTFDDFHRAFSEDIRKAVHTEADRTSAQYEQRALWQPQVIRSLLVDDCIEEGVEYNAGGARYNWSVATIGGIGNVADSLHALREVVFEGEEMTTGEMVRVLEENFSDNESVRQRLMNCARFGNDEPQVDELARSVSELAFRTFLSLPTWRGGTFVPACVLLSWYANWGKICGALPDGRKAGEPIGDSAGPVQGRDTNGPTAMLASVTRLRHDLAPGTLVVNARFSKSYFKEPESAKKLQELIRTYFRLGGMQMQINVVDQETLKKAMESPDEYANLIIRIGGYSELWGRLSEPLRRAVLERTEHE
ncbi:MAG: pyruvate formate lyase family protein [Planctomycetota bacterium]|nr:pyruvate formate lyase family protein [Planctomycetota bacterium]